MKNRSKYIKPVITRIVLDNSISLVMMTAGPKPPMPRGGTQPAPADSPFANPFDNSTFKG